MIKAVAIKQDFLHRLFQFSHISTLAIFRVLLGFLLFYHCISFVVSGRLYLNFIQPPFTFSYIGFDFLQPLPGNGMYIYFFMMALLALMVMAGLFYRFAITGFTVLWWLVYLMQKSNYNNHYYLMLLVCLLMCCMPANKYFSADVLLRPQIKATQCSRWIYSLFRAQTFIIYFYAAISKFDADWLSGTFIGLQFAPLTGRHLTGHLYASPYFQSFIVYAGFLFDLFIVPLLYHKKTRTAAFIVFCVFHLFNSYSFGIGIFPYLSIAMGLFFFEPEKIRQLFFKNKQAVNTASSETINLTASKKIIVAFIAIYLFVQLALPLRSAFYPGNVFWTEEGYRMSWKMMLRKKTGSIHFKVVDTAAQKTWLHHPADSFAPSHVNWLAICPDIAWQYAQHLKKKYGNMGYNHVAVYAIDSVSLNGYPPQLLIDTSVNLATVSWQPFSHSPWILPYKKP